MHRSIQITKFCSNLIKQCKTLLSNYYDCFDEEIFQKHFNEYKYKCSGVWIINGEDVFYNQYSTVTFLCPMRWGWSWLLSSKSSSISKNHDICTFLRFERYPLDEHICKFRVGSTNMDINFMRFAFNSDWLFVFSTFMIFYSLKRMIKIL